MGLNVAFGSRSPKIPLYLQLFFVFLPIQGLCNHAGKGEHWDMENKGFGAPWISLGPAPCGAITRTHNS